MEIPKCAARELTSIADLAMSAIVKNFAKLGLLPADIHVEKFVSCERGPGGVTSRAAPETTASTRQSPQVSSSGSANGTLSLRKRPRRSRRQTGRRSKMTDPLHVAGNWWLSIGAQF